MMGEFILLAMQAADWTDNLIAEMRTLLLSNTIAMDLRRGQDYLGRKVMMLQGQSARLRMVQFISRAEQMET